MATAKDVISDALHLFGIIDIAEDPTPEDLATNIPILSNMLRSEYMDGAAQFLIKRVQVTLPAGISGSVYSFTVKPGGDVDVDAVGVRAIYVNDISPNVNRETRMAPIADVVRTTYPGIITKWHPERQTDGAVLITAWQPPRTASRALIEYGGRIAALTNPDGSDTVALPPEGIHDISLLLGRRLCSSYGRAFDATSPVGQDAIAVDMKWKNWARGQQWLRFVRA